MDNPVTQASLSAERFDLKHPCPTQGRKLAAITDTTNEKLFTNIIPNQPTILTVSQKNLPLVSLKHLSGWEAEINHIWPDAPIQAG